jgi:hypothetical protein
MGELLPHAYTVELIHLCMATIGFCASAFGTIDSVRDLAALREDGVNGHREFSARQNIFEELVRLAVLGLLMYSGFISVFNPPPSPDVLVTDARYYQLVVSRSVDTVVCFLLMVKSVRDLLYRDELRKMISSMADVSVLQVVKKKAKSIVNTIENVEKP